MPSKVCRKCGIEKDISEFNKDSANKSDGLTLYCKKCSNEYSKQWAYNRRLLSSKIKSLFISDDSIKRCYRCGIDKPISGFALRSDSPDGYANLCKDCANEYAKKYVSDHKALVNLKQREYYKSNRKLIADKGKIYRTVYKDEIRKRGLKYRSTPQGKMVHSRTSHNRRIKSKIVKSTLTLEQWEKIISNQGNKCAMCGKRFCKSRPPTKDHIIPLSKGGGLTFENVQALCRNCNSSKYDKIDISKITTWCYA